MEKNRNGYPVSDSQRSTGNNAGGEGGLGFRGGCSAQNPEENTPNVHRGNSMNGGSALGGQRDRNDGSETDGACDEVKLAYVYAPKQKFCMLYSAEEALKHGTLFENLYKPMEVYGRE